MSENPYQSPDGHSAAQRKFTLALLGRLVAYATIICLVIALLLPSIRSAREPARRNQCINNLRQISLALLDYVDANGELPPAYTVDSEGNKLHSWRTLILPYMEGGEIYETIDLSKPWDDPANTKAREELGGPFACPSAPFEPGMTNYFAVVGPECAFAGADARKMEDIADGASTTIFVVEGPSDRAVHWMSPKDVTLDDVLSFGPDQPTGHPGGFMAVYADGHVDFINHDIYRKALRAMLTIADGVAHEGNDARTPTSSTAIAN